MERLKSMKDSLIACVQGQMGNLAEVDAQELGEVVDMIKDLEEAIYYCTITKSMEESKEKADQNNNIQYYSEKVVYPREPYYYPSYYYPERDMDRDIGKMYYDSDNGKRMTDWDNKNTTEKNSMMNKNMTRYYTEVDMGRDMKEGKSPLTRKMYMEGKEKHQDKTYQLKELEKYMTELAQDLTEMIQDASPEEKQYLEKRVQQLATKIGNV